MNKNLIYVYPAGLGDTFCATGALKKLYEKTNKRYYIASRIPQFFCEQPYTDCAIVTKANDIGGINENGINNSHEIFNKFDKIKVINWCVESHLKGKATLVESYCDSLGVDRTKLPYFKFNKDLLHHHSLSDKPYIIYSLAQKGAENFTFGETKVFNRQQSNFIINNLKKAFPKYNFIDLSLLDISNPFDLYLTVAQSASFVSIDTVIPHFASNEFYFKKGVVLWTHEHACSRFGYNEQVNLISNFMHPFDNVEIIVENLKKILSATSFTF